MLPSKGTMARIIPPHQVCLNRLIEWQGELLSRNVDNLPIIEDLSSRNPIFPWSLKYRLLLEDYFFPKATFENFSITFFACSIVKSVGLFTPKPVKIS